MYHSGDPEMKPSRRWLTAAVRLVYGNDVNGGQKDEFIFRCTIEELKKAGVYEQRRGE